MKAKFYQVGGSVRDQLMGLKPKDFDFSVEAESFVAMRQAILEKGGEIFLETEKFLTIRAKVPELGAADYVLCRKDGFYYDGRHPDKVEVGTIFDDLARRDFTMNAIAIDIESGKILDPYKGQEAIKLETIECVRNAKERFGEDGLRMLRALRFAITKNFVLSLDIRAVLQDSVFVEEKLKNVSLDRIRDEIGRCFKHDSLKTLLVLERYFSVRDYIFKNPNLWLKPTSESR